MNIKSAISIVIAFIVALTGMVVNADAVTDKHETAVPEGYIAINNKEDMLALMNYGIENTSSVLTNNYILMSDIAFDMTDFEEGGAFYNNGNAWPPLGSINYPYMGTFDGNGYTISGLVVTDNTDNYDLEVYGSFIGANSGNIKNLRVENTTLEVITTGETNRVLANAYGGIVGINLENGVVSNCSCVNSKVSATSVTVNAYAGGITGYNLGIINNCIVKNSEIVAKSFSNRTDRVDKAIAGGIVGINLDGASIWNVIVIGDVTVAVETSIICDDNAAKGMILGSNNVMAKLVGAYYPDGTEFIGTGSITKAVGIPLLAEQYKVVECFESLDFSNVWEMGEEHPVLRIDSAEETVAPFPTLEAQTTPTFWPQTTATSEVSETTSPSVPATVTPTATPTAHSTASPTASASSGVTASANITVLATATPTVAIQPSSSITAAPSKKPVVKMLVKFTKKSVKIRKGKKTTLKVKITGAKKAKFTTSKKKIVKIVRVKARSVIVKGKKKGKAVITAKASGKKAKCRVIVR